MNATLLDFSERRELARHARVIADVQQVTSALRAPTMITGAFARDLHVFYAYGLDANRQSEDVDFAIAVRDWHAFAEIRTQLASSGSFRTSPGLDHRLYHSAGLPIDLVPFQGVETQSRKIEWPPAGEIVMDVFGFSEALAAAQSVRLPDGVDATVVSLPALALLKLVAWQDRHLRSPRKDAHDLMLIASSHLELGNAERLWNEFSTWTDDENFDYQRAGGRMLGHDIRTLVDARGAGKLATILEAQSSETVPGPLPEEMSRLDPGRARMLLAGILSGVTERR